MKNVGSKSVLLMIVHLQAGRGPVRDERFAEEYFFADALAPGESDVHDVPEERYGAALVNGEPYTIEPHLVAEARAEFVQFSDGTTWGDRDAAEHALYTRKRTVEELDRLEHLYEQKGESTFLEELANADEFLNVISQLKSICREKAAYASCTYNQMRHTLLTARDHEAATKSSGTH